MEFKFRFFIKLLGQAYDLKTVSQDMIKKRVLRTGDGTHPYSKFIDNGEEIVSNRNDQHLWGWDDPEITKNDKNLTEIYNQAKKIY